MHVVLLHDSFICEFEVFRLFSKSAVRTKKGCRFWDLVRFLNDINLCICEKLTLKPDNMATFTQEGDKGRNFAW